MSTTEDDWGEDEPTTKKLREATPILELGGTSPDIDHIVPSGHPRRCSYYSGHGYEYAPRTKDRIQKLAAKMFQDRLVSPVRGVERYEAKGVFRAGRLVIHYIYAITGVDGERTAHWCSHTKEWTQIEKPVYDDEDDF